MVFYPTNKFTTIQLESANSQKHKLKDNLRTHSVVLEAPNAFEQQPQNSEVTLVFPANDGEFGQVLTTDGNGILYWGNVAGASGFNNFLASAYGIKVSEGTTYRLVRLPYSNGDQTLKFIFKRAEFHVETSPTENSARTIILKNGVPITDYIDIVAGEYDSEAITYFDDEYGYSGDVISFEATSVSMSDLWEINLQMISENQTG